MKTTNLLSMLILVIILGVSCKIDKQEKVLKQNSSDAIILNDKGVKLLIEGKLDSALILFDQSANLDTTNYIPHSNKIGIYLRLKEYKKALGECQIATEKNPTFAQGWFMSGLINLYLGDSLKSRTDIEKSIKVFSIKIDNTNDSTKINAHKLNRALSKIFVNDDSYKTDFIELSKISDLKMAVDHYTGMTKDEILKEFIK